ncbi:hypothetical protein [Tropheryma whipplei]|uniref:hypothetical protein n=1 Tax=Tropheryma whipplei TaxID=2039 RepID=UPI0018AD163C|nr:hypothetical protein [Tropheryma whipplei]
MAYSAVMAPESDDINFLISPKFLFFISFLNIFLHFFFFVSHSIPPEIIEITSGTIPISIKAGRMHSPRGSISFTANR